MNKQSIKPFFKLMRKIFIFCIISWWIIKMHTQKRGNTQNSRTNKTSKKRFLCSVFTKKLIPFFYKISHFSYFYIFHIAHSLQSSLFAIPRLSYFYTLLCFYKFTVFLGVCVLRPFVSFLFKIS